MAERDPDTFLYVRAAQPGVTYIGGTFCKDDPVAESLRQLYESPKTPRNLLQNINHARFLVGSALIEGSGYTVQQAIEDTDLQDLTPRRLQLVTSCLVRIEAGLCSMYPPIKHE